MSYTKQTWNNGDIITAEKLNHIEDGISVNNITVFDLINNDQGSMPYFETNATYNDVYQAMENGLAYFKIIQDDGINNCSIESCYYSDGYIVRFVIDGSEVYLVAQNATDPLSSAHDDGGSPS